MRTPQWLSDSNAVIADYFKNHLLQAQEMWAYTQKPAHPNTGHFISMVTTPATLAAGADAHANEAFTAPLTTESMSAELKKQREYLVRIKAALVTKENQGEAALVVAKNALDQQSGSPSLIAIKNALGTTASKKVIAATNAAFKKDVVALNDYLSTNRPLTKKLSFMQAYLNLYAQEIPNETALAEGRERLVGKKLGDFFDNNLKVAEEMTRVVTAKGAANVKAADFMLPPSADGYAADGNFPATTSADSVLYKVFEARLKPIVDKLNEAKTAEQIAAQKALLAEAIIEIQTNFAHYKTVATDSLEKISLQTDLALKGKVLEQLDADYRVQRSLLTKAEATFAKMGDTSGITIQSRYHVESGQIGCFSVNKEGQTTGVTLPDNRGFLQRLFQGDEGKRARANTLILFALAVDKMKFPATISGDKIVRTNAWVKLEILKQAGELPTSYEFKLDPADFTDANVFLYSDSTLKVARESYRSIAIHTERTQLLVDVLKLAEKHDAFQKIIAADPTSLEAKQAAAEIAKPEYKIALELRTKMQEELHIEKSVLSKAKDTITGANAIPVVDSSTVASISGGSLQMGGTGQLTEATIGNIRVVEDFVSKTDVAKKLSDLWKVQTPGATAALATAKKKAASNVSVALTGANPEDQTKTSSTGHRLGSSD